MVQKNIISAERAKELMEKPANFLSRKKSIEYTEMISMPYYLFRSNIVLMNGKTRIVDICVDGIAGEFAFLDKKLSFDDLNVDDLSFLIDEQEANIIANRAVNQFIVSNMKKSIRLKEVITEKIGTFNYPYWLGLYKKGQKGIMYEAIDGITGQKQGPKMAPVLMKLILQEEKPNFRDGVNA